MKLTRHLIWIFPLAIIAAASIIYQVGGSELTRALLRKEIAKLYGVSEATVESYERRLPADWQIGDPIELEAAPHGHSWPAGVEVIDDEDTGLRLEFAHMGDGDFPGQDEPLQTSYVMVNNSNATATGTLSFLDDSGEPLELEINGVTNSVFPFVLNRQSVQKMTAAGSGELKSGWARIRSDQPIVVTSNFGAIRADGTVITDVGVGEAEPGTEFTIFADTIGSNDTGLAVSNPDDEQAIDIQMTLNDAAGVMVDQTVVNLGPQGHLARFLSQLFPSVENIAEFEGTVVLTSTTAAATADSSTLSRDPAGEAPLLPFVGLTLRISGVIFTSVPMVPPPPPDAEHTRLAFPQAADGEVGGFKVSTTPVLFNNTGKQAAGMIEFFQGDGSFNEVGVGGIATSSIPFNIPPRGVFRVDTDGVGELGVGWARVTMDQPLAGVAIFTIKDAQDRIVAAVGVNAALLRRQFELIADTSSLFDTAIALANPLEPGKGEPDTPTRINFTLRDAEGRFIAFTDVALSARQHTSLFVTQLFSEVEGIEEFEGRIQASVNGEDTYVVALSLRSAVEKLTPVPVFMEQHAFAPTLTLEFAQTLPGTSPSVAWTLHQNEEDLAIEFAEIRIAGASFSTSNISPGFPFGVGYLTRPERAIYLSSTSEQEGQGAAQSFSFELIAAEMDDITVLANGTFSQENGETVITMQYVNKNSNTFVNEDSDLVVFVDPGVINVPESAEFETITEFVSVSRSSTAERRVIRRMGQTTETENPDPNLARIEQVTPYLPAGGALQTIQGSNFGEEPTILFPLQGGEIASLSGFLEENGDLTVVVPGGSVPGQLRVDNGNGPGNGYRIRPLFAPRLELNLSAASPSGAGSDSVELNFVQDEDLYPIVGFEVFLAVESASFAGLEAGQAVGSFREREGGLLYGLFVSQVDGSRAVLDIAEDPEVFVQGQLELEIIAGDPPVLQASYHTETFGIQYLTEPNAVLLVLQIPGLVLPPAGEGVSSWAELTSAQSNADLESGVAALALVQEERE